MKHIMSNIRFQYNTVHYPHSKNSKCSKRVDKNDVKLAKLADFNDKIRVYISKIILTRSWKSYE